MAGTVVVFDFDKTIIDCDSDSWVINELGLMEIYNRLLHTMPWNSLMDSLMGKLHSQGKTVDEIAGCLRRAPFHPHIISAIKSAHSLGSDLRIASDANSFFIETILEHHGLVHCFSEINTNPGFVDENGRLRILPYHDFNSSPHGCNLCPTNMCKGSIIERIRSSISAENKRFFYLGDGVGDFCPALKLGEGDKVMPRTNFPMWELIHKNTVLVRAEIHEWSNGEELERVLLQLITSPVGIEENNSFSNFIVDCKSQSLPTPPHEALSQVLPVPH